MVASSNARWLLLLLASLMSASVCLVAGAGVLSSRDDGVMTTLLDWLAFADGTCGAVCSYGAGCAGGAGVGGDGGAVSFSVPVKLQV